MKTQGNYYPIILCSSRVGALTTTFYLLDREIKVHAPKSLMDKLLMLCDGEKTFGEIVEILGKNWEKTQLKGFLRHLKDIGVIHDSRCISEYAWLFIKNPVRFGRGLSDNRIKQLVRKAHDRHQCIEGEPTLIKVKASALSSIIEQRISVRSFSEEPLTTQEVAKLLWAGYGVTKDPLFKNKEENTNRHTVPSAGALYPLCLSLILLRATDSLEAGVYSISQKEAGVVGFTLKESNTSRISSCFLDPLVLRNACGVIAINGSFQVSGEKYGNRAMLYVPLEAGHVAQNIHLGAAENGVGTVEIGGFFENLLCEELKLSAGYVPLTTIVFGVSSLGNEISPETKSNIEIRWALSAIGTYRLPFSLAFARLKDDKSEDWSCGRSTNPAIAALKATSEVLEREACSHPPHDLIRASFKELDNAIDPRKIVRYHEQQYTKGDFPLKPFHYEKKYQWKNAQDMMTGEKVYILSDCIYFFCQSDTSCFTYANSSGTAAHETWEDAVRSATLEVIERDAFMNVWLNRLIMPRIKVHSLPSEVQARIKALQTAGFRVVIKDFTLDLAPVIFVFAQSEIFPMTTCASASDFDILRALDHALMELETAVYCRLTRQSPKPIHPNKVRYVVDHGHLYEQRKFFKRADFLASSDRVLKFSDTAKNSVRTWQELVDRLEIMRLPLFMADLSHEPNQIQAQTLKIVKVFVPGMIPMSFGYGLEPLGMERLYSLPVRLGYLSHGMPYKKLTRFPHPYT